MTLFALLAWSAALASAQVQTQALVSENSMHQAANDNSGEDTNTTPTFFATAASNDGSVVAFMTASTDTVAGDTSTYKDIILRNYNTNDTRRISFDFAHNLESNGDSGTSGKECNTIAVSSDGKKVAYLSRASNLSSTIDANNGLDAYLYDSDTNAQTLVTSGSRFVVNYDVGCVSINSTASVVAFSSEGDFVGLDANTGSDVYAFVYDSQGNVTKELVSVSFGGVAADAESFAPSVSADGSLVAFASFADDLVNGAVSGTTIQHIYLRDRTSGQQSTRILDLSTTASTIGQPGNHSASRPAISADGKFVAFLSDADNLVDNDANGHTDVFVRDLVNGVTKRVDVTDSGAEILDGVKGPISISADGRYVTFESISSGIAPDILQTPGTEQVYVRDIQGGHTYCVSKIPSSSVAGSVDSRGAVLSPDASSIYYVSYSTNLVSQPATASLQVLKAGTNFSSSGGGSGNGGGGGSGNSGNGGNGGGAPVVLTPHIQITDPPVVGVVDGIVTIKLQEFVYVPRKHKKAQPLIAADGLLAVEAAAVHRNAQVQILYEVTIKTIGTGKSLKKTVKKNVLTLHNLRPGNYAVSYNVRAVQGKKTLARSRQSPAALFTIPGA